MRAVGRVTDVTQILLILSRPSALTILAQQLALWYWVQCEGNWGSEFGCSLGAIAWVALAEWKVGLVWFGMACPSILFCSLILALIWQQACSAPVGSLCESSVLAGGDWLFSWGGFLQGELAGSPEPVQRESWEWGCCKAAQCLLGLPLRPHSLDSGLPSSSLASLQLQDESSWAHNLEWNRSSHSHVPLRKSLESKVSILNLALCRMHLTVLAEGASCLIKSYRGRRLLTTTSCSMQAARGQEVGDMASLVLRGLKLRALSSWGACLVSGCTLKIFLLPRESRLCCQQAGAQGKQKESKQRESKLSAGCL